ncbi:MAG: HDOD domain-containing protein [Deltaproteobacteria bacterium]|nr:HDOD domain-containing protein [Deltaproteobacteria bacterium]
MAFYTVLPGKLIATDDPSAILETCLGSCVGVAMYDREAAIGGLIHIMLPTGSEDNEKTSPARYARSGIPLLLDKMIKLGASKVNIVALIAGGAFMLADKKQIVELNIGKRNSDMARQVLNVWEIPIVKQHIGGHFSTVFKLELATGMTCIKTGKERKENILILKRGKEIKLKDLKVLIDSLKPVPETARRIISRMEYSGFSPSDLEKYILQDQVITANVLKICNSAHYGFSSRISSIKKAAALLEAKTLKKIVMNASLCSLYKDGIGAYSVEKGELLNHSLCCAMVAELISQEKKIKSPDVLFTAGLLHDIGKVILDQYIFEKFNLIMDRVLNKAASFLDAENEILGYNHAEIGGLIAREWNLPEVLIEAISFHHQPREARENPEVVSIVHIADNICSMIGYGCGADAIDNHIHQFAISSINLCSDDVDRILKKLPEIVKEVEEAC